MSDSVYMEGCHFCPMCCDEMLWDDDEGIWICLGCDYTE